MSLLATNNGIANDIVLDEDDPYCFWATLDIPLSQQQYEDFLEFAQQLVIPSLRISARSALGQIGVNVEEAERFTMETLNDYDGHHLSLQVKIRLVSSFARKNFRHAIQSLLYGREIARAFIVDESAVLSVADMHSLYTFPVGSKNWDETGIAVPMIQDLYYEINPEFLRERDGASVLRAVVMSGRSACKKVLRLQQGSPKLKRTLVSAFEITSKTNEMPPTHLVLDTQTSMDDVYHLQPILLDQGRTDDHNRSVKSLKRNGKPTEAFQLEFENRRGEQISSEEVPKIFTILRGFRRPYFIETPEDRSKSTLNFTGSNSL